MRMENRTWTTKTRKIAAFLTGHAILLATSGSCLPDNVFADTAGEIVNGLIIAGLNLTLSGSGVQL